MGDMEESDEEKVEEVVEKSDDGETVVEGGDGGDLSGMAIALAKASDGKGMRARSGGDRSVVVTE